MKTKSAGFYILWKDEPGTNMSTVHVISEQSQLVTSTPSNAPPKQTYAPIAERSAEASVSVQRETSSSRSASTITRASGSVPE
jgi:hypothetical protein